MNPPENVMREVKEVLESQADRERVVWLILRVQALYPWRLEDVFVSETRDAVR